MCYLCFVARVGHGSCVSDLLCFLAECDEMHVNVVFLFANLQHSWLMPSFSVHKHCKECELYLSLHKSAYLVPSGVLCVGGISAASADPDASCRHHGQRIL